MTKKLQTRRLRTPPRVGDRVTPAGKSSFVADLGGLVGEVVAVLDGGCGPIVAVRFPELPGRTVDLFWKKLARA